MKLFDTHSHLAGEDLKEKAFDLIDLAEKSQVHGLSFIAADEASLKNCQNLCEQARVRYPHLNFIWSAGIHPHDAKSLSPSLRDLVEKGAQSANAIGETGLDFFYDYSERDIQDSAFRFHIQLAKKLSKPLVIHCRNSAKEILETLDGEKIKEHSDPGILHCFAENDEMAKAFLDRGLHISFSGILTFKNANSLRETAKWIPLDRLLIETDAPYLAPVPNRGKENQPAFVLNTFETLAAIRPEKREVLADQLWQNSCKLFKVT
ncbi:TatD family hydrolase [bacterium]|nr:TatD family hydrolase [bacterium]